MKEPLWLSEEFLIAANGELVDHFGGLKGHCNKNLLHSAINRPRHLFEYGEPSLFDLAAAYGFALAKNHCFSDGNKRIAFMAMQTFLDINGWELKAEETETVVIMIELAASIISEADMAKWLKKNCVKMKNETGVLHVND